MHIDLRRVALLLAGISVSGFSSATQAQNLLTNPSFETGAFVNQGSGYMILNTGSTSIAGWTVTPTNIAWCTTPNSDSITAFDGSFFLDLQGPGLGGALGGVTQSVATIPGGTYHVSFNLGTQQSITNDRGPVSVNATGGTTTLPFTFNPGGTGTQWGEFGFDFIASSTSSPITITGTSTADGAYIGLDLVSVTLVPEPSAIALLAGVLSVTVVRRR